jgi:cyclophilin family peptidyl-prolyl cis-trans isomerase
MNIKFLTIGLMIVFLTVTFSGCNDLNLGEVTQFSITSFNVNPTIINEGETANLSWVVMSAQSASIDHDIGNVSNAGNRIIQPTESTTYTLTAVNGSKTLTATTQIIVTPATEREDDSDENSEGEESGNDEEDDSSAENDAPIALIDTSMGTIKVELYIDMVPNTVQNFIDYANDGFYDGLVFHRVIDGFMIQGGGFYPDGTQKETDEPIDLEIHPEALHVDGAIAMARTSYPDSATSQFFINDGAQSQLEPGGVDPNGYAVFGVVIDGMDIVRSISDVATTTKHSMQNWPVDDVIINSITIES